MPVYTCPECATKLKRSEPVEPGKKLRCPECSTVFAVAAKSPAKKKSAAAPGPAPAKHRFADEDDGPANYGLAAEAAESEEDREEREKAFGPIKQRFEKGKRGPALELVVKPSTFLLMCGVVTVIMGITTGLVATWPMIFKQEEVSTKKKGLYDVGTDKTKFVELTPDQYRERFIWLGGGILYALWGAVICAGASKMHEVQTYWLAFTASAMAIIGPVLPLGLLLLMWAYEDPANAPDQAYMGPAIIFFALGVPVSLWNISTLLKKPVKDGFEDTTPVI